MRRLVEKYYGGVAAGTGLDRARRYIPRLSGEKIVELDLCQVTKFTPYPGTPAYPTIREFGRFDEDWERMLR